MSNRTHADLIYAAYSRCPCGAGLAHLVDVTRDTQFWDCSAIWLGTADKAVQHTGQLPFAFYEVKSEQQASANGATTRPVDAAKARKPTPMLLKPSDEKVKVLLDALYKSAPDRFQRCTMNGKPANMLVTDSRPYDKEKDGANNPTMTTWWLFDDGTIEYATDCQIVSHAIDFGGAQHSVIVEDVKVQFDQAIPAGVSVGGVELVAGDHIELVRDRIHTKAQLVEGRQKLIENWHNGEARKNLFVEYPEFACWHLDDLCNPELKIPDDEPEEPK